MRQLVPLVKVVNLGRISYAEGLKLQNEIQQRILKDDNSGGGAGHTLLVLEHNPVYTLGFRENMDEKTMKELVKCGAEIVKSDRGGLTTFHGPGQLVAYPILNLQKFRNLTLRNYISLLENTAIHTCRMLGLPAVKGKDSVAHTGAWVNDKKICAIGVHCKRYVTKHGLALNCNTNLDWFTKIVPCGIPDKGVTSLSNELEKDIPISNALPQFLASFQSIFACNLKFDGELHTEDKLKSSRDS